MLVQVFAVCPWSHSPISSQTEGICVECHHCSRVAAPFRSWRYAGKVSVWKTELFRKHRTPRQRVTHFVALKKIPGSSSEFSVKTVVICRQQLDRCHSLETTARRVEKPTKPSTTSLSRPGTTLPQFQRDGSCGWFHLNNEPKLAEGLEPPTL